jgi:hypothetical protein
MFMDKGIADRGLDAYRKFVDKLVARREGVLPRWIKEKGWPRLAENEKINSFLSTLTPDLKDVVVEIARTARDGGIHDTLVQIQEQMDLDGLRLFVDGVELPVSPYGTELFFDWVARAAGEPWPDQNDSQ